jgi:hypothetical protein
MLRYEYRVVPFIGKIKGKQAAAEVSRQLQAVIQENANQGWEFCQITDVNIEIAPGCLGSLLGGKESYARFDQVVFRRAGGEQ